MLYSSHQLWSRQRADSRDRKYCTLRGLLVVNGEALGLTTGHPLREVEHNVIRRGLKEAAQDTEGSSDEESSTTSIEPFVFNDGDDDFANDDMTASTVSLHKNNVLPTSNDGTLDRQHKISRRCSPSTKWYLPQAAVFPVSTPGHFSSIADPHDVYDWALLETLPPAVRSQPNKIPHFDLHHDILIDGTTSGPACGEVTIAVAGIGLQLEYLHSSPATMKVDEFVLDVQLITLERVLRSFLCHL